jgi:hypothetical protein
MFYPAISTAALFTAIIIHDAMTKQASSIPTHAFLGLISILAMLYLSMKGADFVAWGILILPMFIIALSFVLVYVGSARSGSSAPAPKPAPAPSPAPKTGSSSTPASVGVPASSCSSCNNNPVLGQTTNPPSSTVITPTSNCNVHV